jgi:hypothetical protein
MWRRRRPTPLPRTLLGSEQIHRIYFNATVFSYSTPLCPFLNTPRDGRLLLALTVCCSPVCPPLHGGGRALTAHPHITVKKLDLKVRPLPEHTPRFDTILMRLNTHALVITRAIEASAPLQQPTIVRRHNGPPIFEYDITVVAKSFSAQTPNALIHPKDTISFYGHLLAI